MPQSLTPSSRWSQLRSPRGVRPPRERRLAAFAGLAAAALLAVLLAVIVDALSSPAAAPQPAGTASGTAGAAPIVFGGPGGRVALALWRVRADPADHGLLHDYPAGRFAGTLEHVPYVPNAQPITGPAGVHNYDGSIAWYRTSFNTTRAGRYAVDFISVNHLATVWLDGRRLGTHVGTYLPFEFSAVLPPGTHVLVVRADWRDPAAQAREGFHRTWFNFGGIDREVTVRPVGPSDLQSPSVHTVLDAAGDAVVTVAAPIHNLGPTRSLTPGGTLVNGSSTIPLRFPAVSVPRGTTVTDVARATVKQPDLWAPGHPSLYTLHLEVGTESSYTLRTGLRQLSWSGGRLFLNGHRLILHGASLQEDVQGHGDALTPADEDGLIADLRSIGANATRSQHALDPALLERLDAAGILVWQGVGPVDPAGDWSSKTPALMAEAEHRVRVTAAAEQTHPSIIAWNLANEIAGNGHSGGQIHYVEAMSRQLHASDPGRLVAVDVWGEHPPQVAGPLYAGVDAVGETNYAGWYDGPLSPPAAVAADIHHVLSAMHAAFAGKVQIISEFGAEANYQNAPGSPGSYSFQAGLVAQHIQIYAHDPALSGMLVWDLRDFAVAPTFAGGSIKRRVPGIRVLKGLNQKGLFSYERQPKPAAQVVRRLYRSLGGSSAL